MSSPTVFELIETRLRASWAETPLVFENEDYSTPAEPENFVYVEIFGDLMTQDTIGAPGENEWVEVGQLNLHVMTPNGIGSGAARGMAYRLTYLFREQSLDGIFFREMSIGAGEPGRNFGNYFAMTATINWDRRDITQLP